MNISDIITFVTTNKELIGFIVAIIGGVWAVYAHLKRGSKSKGKLKIDYIKVVPDKEEKRYLIDFRVLNDGGSDVTINSIRFKLIDYVEIGVKGALELSNIYDLDLSDLTTIGKSKDCDVAQVVKPGEADRFGVKVTALSIPFGKEIGWKLLPTLVTNVGEYSKNSVDIWFPLVYDPEPPWESFEEAKEVASWEEPSYQSKEYTDTVPDERRNYEYSWIDAILVTPDISKFSSDKADWTKVGNLFWLSHDLIWTAIQVSRYDNTTLIKHGLSQCIHHLSELNVTDNFYYKKIANYIEMLDEDTPALEKPEFRYQLAVFLRGLSLAIGYLSEDSQENFRSHPY